ncbi:hypothetical protein Rs2_29353 [Raphanus sativus]|nr:hypothetical protein Rs2_29353 [Raphanus sativus]
MAGGTGTSMLGSILLFTVILSLQEVYRGKLASTELLTIFGGFTSSLLFLFSLTFIGNLQESSGVKSGWGAADPTIRTTQPSCGRNSGFFRHHYLSQVNPVRS